MQLTHSKLLKKIEDTCQSLEKEFSLIPSERKKNLCRLSEYITHKIRHRETPKIIVICTHNSRRSHLGQIWLAVGANYFGLPTIETYSGGTEATAFNIRAVNTLQKIGFDIISKAFKTATNPIYEVNWLQVNKPYLAFSKKYNESPNPFSNFGAIMVCNSADQGCPIVPGADFRVTIPYEDPKAFDNTNLEDRNYAERCWQIGREMLYVMSQVKSA